MCCFCVSVPRPLRVWAVFMFPSHARFARGLFLCFRPTPASLVGCFLCFRPTPASLVGCICVSVPCPLRWWAVFVFLSHARFARGLLLFLLPRPPRPPRPRAKVCVLFSHAQHRPSCGWRGGSLVPAGVKTRFNVRRGDRCQKPRCNVAAAAVYRCTSKRRRAASTTSATSRSVTVVFWCSVKSAEEEEEEAEETGGGWGAMFMLMQ